MDDRIGTTLHTGLLLSTTATLASALASLDDARTAPRTDLRE